MTEAIGPLLNGARLIAGDHVLRPIEVECYIHADSWPDPYVHRDPRQLRPATWYIHRKGGSYKQGTFKGLDLTAGDGEHTHVGVLIRSLETEDGARITGPCNCVHHVMACLDVETLEELDAMIGAHGALSRDNALHIRCIEETAPRHVFASPRVGLNLKRVRDNPRMIDYLHAPLRYTTAPDLTKGRKLNVLQMLVEHTPPARVRELTRASECTILRTSQSILAGQAARQHTPDAPTDSLAGIEDIAFLHGYLRRQ